MAALLDQNLYGLVVESLPVGLCVVNMTGKICLWSAGAERLTGYLRQDVLGHHCHEEFFEHMDLEDNPRFGAAPLLETIRNGHSSDSSASLRSRSGDLIPVDVHTVPLRDDLNSMQGAMEIFVRANPGQHDDRRQSKLAGIGCLDALTGLLNHSMIHAHLNECLGLLHVYPVPFCVLCISVDHLPKLRERYGQAAVDVALRTVAQTVEKALRPTDFVGRWLHQEFLAILTECSAGEVAAVCDRLSRMVHRTPLVWWGDSLHVSVSIGASQAHDHDSPGDIVNRAERALRDSIERGGDQVVFVER
jgi:diguanylate cyclase (GGDEF)-like protein/PAS domain S-box-containing protein